MEYIADTLDADTIFMQDNAPIHKAEIVVNWLQKQEFMVMDWPLYSLDLNSIEHTWLMLKATLQWEYPDIATMREGSNAIKRKLAEVLPNVWRSLSLEFFQILCANLPYRVAAVRAIKDSIQSIK